MTKTAITIERESFWKLLEIKAKIKAKTWDEFADKIYKIIASGEEEGKNVGEGN